MNQCKNRELVTSVEGIDYFVIREESENPRPFGIFAASTNDPEDIGVSQHLFFTREEACKCCLWLADNQVYPITLCDVLDNFYRV